MSDTPRMNASAHDDGAIWETGCDIERELNAANERIRLLISERDTAQAYADQKWKLRREFHDLFGTDDVEHGMTVVREMKDRIKRLEEGGDKAILNSYLPDRLAVWNKAKEDKL